MKLGQQLFQKIECPTTARYLTNELPEAKNIDKGAVARLVGLFGHIVKLRKSEPKYPIRSPVAAPPLPLWTLRVLRAYGG